MFFRKYVTTKEEPLPPLKQSTLVPPHNLSVEKQNEARTLTEKAIEENKIFIIQGPYPTVRRILRDRGWVEKFYQFSSYRTKLGELKQNDYNPDDSDVDNTDDNRIDYTAAEEKILPWKEDDGYYAYMYRLVQKYEPAFFWGARRDFFDQRLLMNYQIVNHFMRTVFTTKVGLCLHLRELHWYQQNTCHSFYPRAYQLAQPEDKLAFEQDFCLTASVSILKIIINNSTKECSKRTFFIPAEVFELACSTCNEHLRFIAHEDLDEPQQEEFSSEKFSRLLRVYDSIKRLDITVAIYDFQEKRDSIVSLLEKMKQTSPQYDIDGTRNVWILKPGAKSRGRGIRLLDELEEITKLVDAQVGMNEKKYVIQKYIEKPLLIYKTKFDIRQWFLVTDWNPLTIWFYRDSYVRFCSQQFSLDNFKLSIHLSNNSIQKHYTNDKSRPKELPENNMWTCHELKAYIKKSGAPDGVWDQIIFEGMKNAVYSSLLCCQEIVENRKNTFELFGADFMLGEDYQPWLIEINSSPCMASSTSVTAYMCPMVLEDTLKVVLDLKTNKYADTGLFQLAFRQNQILIPSFFGPNFQVEGQPLFRSNEIRSLSCPTPKNKSRSRKSIKQVPFNFTTLERSKSKPNREKNHRNKSRNANSSTCRYERCRRKLKPIKKRHLIKIIHPSLSPPCFEGHLNVRSLHNDNKLQTYSANFISDKSQSNSLSGKKRKRLNIKMKRCVRCKRRVSIKNQCRCYLYSTIKDLNLPLTESELKLLNAKEHKFFDELIDKIDNLKFRRTRGTNDSNLRFRDHSGRNHSFDSDEDNIAAKDVRINKPPQSSSSSSLASFHSSHDFNVTGHNSTFVDFPNLDIHHQNNIIISDNANHNCSHGYYDNHHNNNIDNNDYKNIYNRRRTNNKITIGNIIGNWTTFPHSRKSPPLPPRHQHPHHHYHQHYHHRHHSSGYIESGQPPQTSIDFIPDSSSKDKTRHKRPSGPLQQRRGVQLDELVSFQIVANKITLVENSKSKR